MNKLNLIVALLVIVLISGVFLFHLTVDKPDYSGYEKQIENLTALNDSLILSNGKLDVELLKLKSESDSLLALIHEDRHIIETLKRKKIEKVTAINSFDHDELFEFFSSLRTGAFEANTDSSTMAK